MLVLKKVAVTGGLSSGKSSVCRILESCGAYVVSADQIVHQLLSPNSIVSQQVVTLLGPGILTKGKIDRSKVSRAVFGHLDKLQALERLLHPIVFKEIEESYQKLTKEHKYRLFVAEVPLLYESQAETFFDATIAVITDPVLAKQRFKKNSSHDPLVFEHRMARQLDPMQKAARANFVITNNGSLQELEQQTKKIYSQLIQ